MKNVLLLGPEVYMYGVYIVFFMLDCELDRSYIHE